MFVCVSVRYKYVQERFYETKPADKTAGQEFPFNKGVALHKPKHTKEGVVCIEMSLTISTI